MGLSSLAAALARVRPQPTLCWHGPHFSDTEVKEDCEAVLIEMLPSLDAVSEALDEYHEYHKKRGRFANKPLLWVRAGSVSPADFWLVEAPKVKWLNNVGASVLSLTYSAGGAERNWCSHGSIASDKRKGQQNSSTLERLLRLYRNMRLRDRALGRGCKAQKAGDEPAKAYPLETGDWSSCDESDADSAWDAVTAPYGFSGMDRR